MGAIAINIVITPYLGKSACRFSFPFIVFSVMFV